MRLPAPLIFSDQRRAPQLSRGVAAGRLRRVARGIYSTDLSTAPEELVRRHWLEVTAHFFPGALIADRSAVQPVPDDGGFLYVVHPRRAALRVPGLAIIPRQGRGPLADDTAMPYGLWLSSPARALLENLMPSRASKGRPRRTLTEAELHSWVLQLRVAHGAERLNALRDRARTLCVELGRPAQFAQLDSLIGAALGTRQVETAVPALASAQRGLSYDPRREAPFKALAQYLRDRPPEPRPVLELDRRRNEMLPFFEAYFSNYIEGTEFTLEEAEALIYRGVVPANRPADAHDVQGTFELLADDAEMSRTPSSFDELLGLLTARHARIMGRPETAPGQFKDRANQAGTTLFVAPELVRGTLALGFEQLSLLRDPFARAVFMMFLISEVHPFNDGNGRLARVMMNAELHAVGESRIIIPTIFRNEYLSSLRALTHNAKPQALESVLDFAQRYTAQIDFSTVESARAQLTATHAFRDSTEAQDRGIRLVLPSSLPRT